MTTPQMLWSPSERFVQDSNLTDYMLWLERNKSLVFTNYDELWRWSTSETKAFWESLSEYFNLISKGTPQYAHSDDHMPDTQWFKGMHLNYAEHIFRNKTSENPAILFSSERVAYKEITWDQLESKVAALSSYLKQVGVEKGDRVVAFIPNIPEATIGFLATCTIGAIWSSCSPDFGATSVIDRFKQIEPKVLIATDGYQYGGKHFDKTATIKEIIGQLPSLQRVLQIPYLKDEPFLSDAILWDDALVNTSKPLIFEKAPFDHPIWVLYSSGTTGHPKAITHSQGGVLLEHLKYVTFHNDVKPGERYFWFTTTGWMMWNFVQATLLVGATIVLYDGNPIFPTVDRLWELTETLKINHFGTSAPYIMACMKSDFSPSTSFDLKSLRSLSSTGSPLPPEGFSWINKNIGEDIWMISMSGGTDVCSAFVGGCPLEPVFEGEIQRRALGCAMDSFDEKGQPLLNEVGEMVITKPMPSMPIYFWGDENNASYQDSYFDMYENIWRHGDWLEITDRSTLIIKGRSDATLNRHGIRIGTAEVYQSVNKIDGIKDSLVVNLEMESGNHFMPLFVVMDNEVTLTKNTENQISLQLKSDFTPRHVPDRYFQVEDIPYTLSGKKMEAAVKKVLQGKSPEQSANLGAMKNPNSLILFEMLRDLMK